MKKIIAIVLMLCLMIPTCFAENNFRNDVVLEIKTLQEEYPEKDFSYIYKSYQKNDSENIIDAIYIRISDGTLYFYVNTKSGYYEYKANNISDMIYCLNIIINKYNCLTSGVFDSSVDTWRYGVINVDSCWIKGYYVDVFGDKTGEIYYYSESIYNNEGKQKICFIVEKNNIIINCETFKPKYDSSYDVTIKTKINNKTNTFWGRLCTDNVRIKSYYSNCKNELISLFNNGGKILIPSYSGSDYVFTVKPMIYPYFFN